MYKARKWEDEEESHAQHQMCLEDRMHIQHVCRRSGLQRHYPLRPVHEFYHFMTIEMSRRYRNSRKSEQELCKQEQQDRGVAERGVRTNTRIEQAPVSQQRNADETHQTGDTAGYHRKHLLEPVGNAEHVKHPDGRQEADEVTGKDYQDADVEQVRSPHHLPTSQQLARTGAPCVLFAIESEEAPEQKYREAKVGIPAEDDGVERLHHCCLPLED